MSSTQKLSHVKLSYVVYSEIVSLKVYKLGVEIQQTLAEWWNGSPWKFTFVFFLDSLFFPCCYCSFLFFFSFSSSICFPTCNCTDVQEWFTFLPCSENLVMLLDFTGNKHQVLLNWQKYIQLWHCNLWRDVQFESFEGSLHTTLSGVIIKDFYWCYCSNCLMHSCLCK